MKGYHKSRKFRIVKVTIRIIRIVQVTITVVVGSDNTRAGRAIGRARAGTAMAG